MNIVLIGMPGAGKSRVGFEIARKTFRRFIDTDRLIKKKYGDIPTLFLTEGEEKFREYEREAVREAALHKRAVISTGGGVILSEENMRLLKKDAFVVFLDATVRTLAGRIARSDRPIAARGIEGIEELYEKRRPLYLKYADFVTDANGYGAAEKAETILAAWREYTGTPGEMPRSGEGISGGKPEGKKRLRTKRGKRTKRTDAGHKER